jgi:hypothetical protein
MTERKFASLDNEESLTAVEMQAAKMPDEELAKVRAKFDAEAAKRQKAKAPALDFAKMDAGEANKKIREQFGFDPGWR